MPDGTPLLSKETLYEIECRYKSGDYKSVADLSRIYSIPYQALYAIIKRNEWDKQMEELREKAQRNIEKKVLSEGEKYLKESFARVKRYEKMLDLSQDQLGAKSSDGTPLLDPEAIQDYVLTETRLHTWGKSCLMIPDASRSVDITSKGQSLGESLVSAIQKARENPNPIKITSEEVQRIIEADIVEE